MADEPHSFAEGVLAVIIAIQLRSALRVFTYPGIHQPPPLAADELLVCGGGQLSPGISRRRAKNPGSMACAIPDTVHEEIVRLFKEFTTLIS